MRAIKMGNYILEMAQRSATGNICFFLMAMDIFCGIIWVIFRQIIGDTTQIQCTRTSFSQQQKSWPLLGISQLFSDKSISRQWECQGVTMEKSAPWLENP
jgi:hypothetical protein